MSTVKGASRTAQGQPATGVTRMTRSREAPLTSPGTRR